MSCDERAHRAVQADERNIELFDGYGTREKADEPMYTCTECGRAVSISGSVSEQGRDLVCNACAMRGFGPGWMRDLRRIVATWQG